MYKFEKGMTIIECMVWISLMMIITSILAKLFINVNYIFAKCEEEQINESDINDLFINIERFLSEDGVQKIDFTNNSLVICKGTKDKTFKKEVISKQENEIIIKYYDITDFEDYNARNTLAKNIDDLKIIKKEKLLYITVLKGGKEYIKVL